MTQTNPSTRPKRSRMTRAQRILASLIASAGVDEIGAAERLTRKRTESILRQELRNRWVAPADDFAKLQIARLEQMILKLLDRVQDGDLRTIDGARKSSTGLTAITDLRARSASRSITARKTALDF